MHIEFLVEEPSAEAALSNLVPRILGPTITYRLHPHQGKQDLLGKLPGRLRGYRAWLPQDTRIVILIDEDRQDCRGLKLQIESVILSAHFNTKASPAVDGSFQVLNRIAVEELESWLLGDVDALVAAYPKVDANLAKKAKYRDPDTIAGGTWEALERVLRNGGYFTTGINKITVARTISFYMDPERNRSKSFQVFRSGLVALVQK